jgi:hypothetical protein
MFVAVSLPSLDELTLQGDGNITVVGIGSRSLSVVLPGTGVIQATGTTMRLDVRISGAGTAMLGPLIAHDVTASLSGAGSVTLTATDTLNASVSGSGTILYGGNPPHVATRVTGNGTIAAE